MDTVQIKPGLQVSFQDILNGLSKSELPDIERFMTQIGSLVAKRKAPNLSRKETELLLKINESLPADFMKRYAELLRRSAEGKLTDKENEEARAMTPHVERQSVERLQSIVELASLWEKPVEEVMNHLGITPPPTIYA